MRLFLGVLIFLAGCDIPVPDSGCAKVTKEGNVIHVEYCDGGVAGSAGNPPVAGSGGAGVGGSSSAGTAGHDHTAGMSASGAGGVSGAGVGGSAGMGGMSSAGAGGAHMHGGLPVTLPFPAARAGTSLSFPGK